MIGTRKWIVIQREVPCPQLVEGNREPSKEQEILSYHREEKKDDLMELMWL